MITLRPRLESLLKLALGALLAAGGSGCAPGVAARAGQIRAHGPAEGPSEIASAADGAGRAAVAKRLERWRARLEAMLAAAEQALRGRTASGLPED